MSRKQKKPGEGGSTTVAAGDDSGTRPAAIPVVGVGASAGGLGAFRELLGALPADTGMAFVLFQHLAAEHHSILPELLRESAAMPVQEVTDGLALAPNQVYVAPSGYNLSLSNGRLYLLPDEREAAPRRIDRFFQALADELGSLAVGVVLSGTGFDGAEGLQAIRSAGGLTFAQDTGSASQPGMPRHAAERGGVDAVLKPAAIAAELTRIARMSYLGEPQAEEETAFEPADLDSLFALLQARTGHDFSAYKRATIGRRLRRRMVVHRCERLSDYLALLRREPTEVDALFQDILINVTQFFREPESFEALREQVFPALLETRQPGVPLRIWIPGCSSGEEVYSVLIALMDYLGDRQGSVPIQVFASDLDPDAIEKARRGLYSEQAMEKLSPAQRTTYFVHRPEGYEIIKPLRNLCVFAVHNLLRDPPFSHVDLVCCRNLLIYLQPSLQKRALQVIHYSLEHDRFLLLGHSESIGWAPDLFAAVDARNKLFRKKPVAARVHYDAAAIGQTASLEMPQPREPAGGDTAWAPEQAADRLLLDHFVPAAVVVTDTGQVRHFRGRTGRYLQPAPGVASLNLLKLVVRELVIPLRTLLHQAGKSGKPVRKEHVPMPDVAEAVNLEVRPMAGPTSTPDYYLVVFEPVPAAVHTASAAEPGEYEPRVAELEGELGDVREYLQSIIDDQEQVNEQLRIANEEVLSSNEELQSNNEEMETSREELQSTNEELATVNQELEARNRELGQLNADLQNLLSCVSIPVVMLTRDLRIRYYTPMAEEVLNLIPGDVGRPVSDIHAKVSVPDLDNLVQRVMDSVTPATREVEAENGRLYYVRVRPYKTEDNRIDGAVLAYIDISHLKDVAAARRRASQVQETSDAVAVVELGGRIIAWNAAAERLYGYTEREAMGMELFDMFEPDAHAPLREALQRLREGHEAGPLRIRQSARDGNSRLVALSLSPLRGEDGIPIAVIATEQPVDDN